MPKNKMQRRYQITMYTVVGVATCEARQTRPSLLVCGTIYLLVTSPG